MNNIFAIVISFLFFGLSNLQSQTIIWSKKSNSLPLSTYGVAFSANGEKVLSGSECHPAAIRMFDVATGNMDWNYNVGSSFMCIQGVKFSSNGSYIASVEELGNILIFDNTGATPVILDTIDTGTSYAFSADFSPANDKIVIGCSNGKLKIYNLPSGTPAASITAHSSYVFSASYSPDGMMIATGGSDKKVKIWSVTGTLLFTCLGHGDGVNSVKFSPDNAFLISCSSDGEVKIWNTTNGSLVKTIVAHTNEIKQVDISPDGNMIVTASADQTCKIWNINTGDSITTFGKPNGGVAWSANWSPNGNQIVTGTSNGDVILWDVSSLSGTDELDKSVVLEVFPNPASDKISIHLSSEVLVQDIEITDAVGKVVRKMNTSDRNLSILTLESGVYFLKITTASGQIAARCFIKTKF
jgi:WD40 repeat protein